ncbi:MAG: PQQ-binding-like beta-propeller repeat protein [Gammaproteobacteria bacterium]
MLQKPDAADWLTWRRTTDGWGFSPLAQITRRNVKRLQLVWTRGLGSGVQEGTPLVHDGVMFFPNPGDFIQALDAATGDLQWEHRRRLPADLGKYVAVAVTNRNLAIYDHLILDLGADSYVYALDAKSGEMVWETKVLDYRKSGLQGSGPIIAGGKVISGRSCEPASGPDACVITAHDPMTGKELWRTRTIPKQGEPGDDTWGGIPDEQRRQVGAWMAPSYDPALNLIYVGTSVTAPAPKYMLAGNERQYLYHNSTLALNADTGKIIWYYQHIVDHWDLDHAYERILLDTQVAPDAKQVTWINPAVKPGRVRKVLTGIPGKTGIVYTLDRQTGEFLWARPTIFQNVVKGIDGATGRVSVNPDVTFDAVGQERVVCPHLTGGKNWQAGTYSPLAHTMFFPLQNTCSNVQSIADNGDYSIVTRGSIAPGTDKLGTIYAISVKTGALVWKYQQRAATMSLLSSAGGLVFAGDVSGRFRAFDDRNGNILWEVNLGSAVTGFPVTYSVGGRQYVAVSTGTSIASSGTTMLTPEIHPGNSSNLFVFALPTR